jgi:hypothetical protein
VAKLFEYVALLRHKGQDGFIAAFPHPFLVQRVLATPDSGQQGLETARVIPSVNEIIVVLTAGAVKISGNVMTFTVHPVVCRQDSARQDRVTLGRSVGNDVVVDVTSISKTHAYLQGKFPKMTIVDANSKNGVTLNGNKLPKKTPTPIKSGDSFALGSVPFVLYDARSFAELVLAPLLKV